MGLESIVMVVVIVLSMKMGRLARGVVAPRRPAVDGCAARRSRAIPCDDGNAHCRRAAIRVEVRTAGVAECLP